MGAAPRPYVNCHFCNARIPLGYAALDAIRTADRAALLECRACHNADAYEPCMIRDPLLMPQTPAHDTFLPRHDNTPRAA